VLRANLLALGTRVLEHGPLVAVFVLLWAAVRALSLNPFRILQKLTRRGRRCWVHPDAVVEGCLLGDDVKIDAGAVLRGCVLGDGAKVGPGVVAEYTVIGQGAELQKQSTAVLSVVYPEARLGGVLQLGLAGRGARLKMGAYCTDMNLQGPVRVLTPEGLRPVDMGYQGVCLGHGAFVASGVWIAPGRVIEAGRVVLRPEGSMVLK
jgi:NDP-sugar pyrophosphorylase family protein